jgi:hypothetical protein
MSKLRVGLLLDSFTQAAWVYKMLEIVTASDFAEVILVIQNNAPPYPRKNRLHRLWENRDSLAYVIYRNLENLMFKPKPDAHARRDIRSLVADRPVLKVIPRRTRFSDSIEATDVAQIKSYDLDVLVRLGFRILRGGVLQAARYGIWSYHHGDNEINRGMPAGFWEVLQHHPTTGSILQILSEDLDNGEVLYRSWSGTDHLSVNRNINNFYWKSLSFLPRTLQELHRNGAERFFTRVRRQNESPAFYSSRLYMVPGNLEMSRLLLAHWIRYLKLRGDVLLHPEQQWMLMYDLRSNLSTSFWRFQRMVAPSGTFWADPHALYRDGKYYIFFEDYSFKSRKGSISLITLDESGDWRFQGKVLDRPYHLAYPFVFEWKNDVYMIPDSNSKQTVEVYRCSEFPDKWEFHTVLMSNIKLMDATLHEHNGKWWLFGNVRERDGMSNLDELFLFSADSPLSDQWRPHPCNPIVSDVRCARPAGRLFCHNGHLYRPSQNSSYFYGYGLKINEVITLNDEEYEEKEVSAISPNWDPSIIGLHTINHTGRLTIIDAQRRRFFTSS